ncbi:MAG: RebB family R body protein [Alphaproteobacteria bacterium]|nr:RebB family R body protein [Alphaproteobacteria bacterium]
MSSMVNSQITDAVTQANVAVVGQSPAMAVGALNQALASSMSLVFANAVAAQQNMNVMAQAATTAGVTTIYSAAGSQTENMLSLLSVLKATDGVK